MPSYFTISLADIQVVDNPENKCNILDHFLTFKSCSFLRSCVGASISQLFFIRHLFFRHPWQLSEQTCFLILMSPGKSYFGSCWKVKCQVIRHWCHSSPYTLPLMLWCIVCIIAWHNMTPLKTCILSEWSDLFLILPCFCHHLATDSG